ncbi:MAG: hypothetical protein MI754_18350 [Chromatiales bacterium]|nr:hypothetical protein [Chromatiales bacterium]
MGKIISRLVQTVRRSFIAILLVVLVVTNVLSITSASFHSAIANLLSHTPFEELLNNSLLHKKQEFEAENKKLRKENKRLIAARNAHRSKLLKARKISRGIARRTAKNIAIDMTSMIGKATPYLGIGLVVTSTAADVHDGCETVKDVNEILRTLDEDGTLEPDSEVCGIEVPSTDEIVQRIKEDIGGTLHQAKEHTQQGAHKLYDAIGGTTYRLKEQIDESSRKFYSALNDTLDEVFN